MIKVGEYYIDPKYRDIVRVDSIEDNEINFTVIVEVDQWSYNQKHAYIRSQFEHEYKHIPAYNTPLYKTLNN